MNMESLSRDDVERMVRVSPQQFIQSLESDSFRHSLGKVLSSMSSGDVKNLCFGLNPQNNTTVAGGFRVITDPQCLNMLEYLQNTRINLQNNPHYQIGSFAIFEQEREGESIKERMQRLENKRKEKQPDTLKAMNEQLMHWQVRTEISLAQMAATFERILNWNFENMSKEEQEVFNKIGDKAVFSNALAESAIKYYEKMTGRVSNEKDMRVMQMMIYHQSNQLDNNEGINRLLVNVKKKDPQLYQETVNEFSKQNLLENGEVPSFNTPKAFAVLYTIYNQNDHNKKTIEKVIENKDFSQAVQKDLRNTQETMRKNGEARNSINQILSENSSGFLAKNDSKVRNITADDLASRILDAMGINKNKSQIRQITNHLNKLNDNHLKEIYKLAIHNKDSIKVETDPEGNILVNINDNGKNLLEMAYSNLDGGGGMFKVINTGGHHYSPDGKNPTLKSEIIRTQKTVNMAALDQVTNKESNPQEPQTPLLFGGGNMQSS